MTGVSVGWQFFAFDCKGIDLSDKQLGEAALLLLLESFSRGEFTHVKILKLVIAVLANWYLLNVTRVIQEGNAIGDIGAKLIGKGLKVNSSLVMLQLVIAALASLYLLNVTRVIQGRNAIGDFGAKMIGEGLKVNSSLDSLDLVSFFLFLLEPVGGRAGRGSSALTRVLQEENQIGVAGAAGLGEGLKVNGSLRSLDLVTLFVIVCFCGGDAGRGRGGGRLLSRLCCRRKIKLELLGLQGWSRG
jgi:hypothetical protein